MARTSMTRRPKPAGAPPPAPRPERQIAFALGLSAESRAAAYLIAKGYRIVESGSMSAGDATFHSGWTLHGAPGNGSDRMREVMTIIYFPDGTRVAETDNANRVADLEAWLPGLQPGDLAASELNPLVS